MTETEEKDVLSTEDVVIKEDQEISSSEGAEYEVEAILGVKAFVKENTLKYQIRWVGYSEEYDSWEPEENLTGAEGALKNFKQTHNAEMQRASNMLEKHKAKFTKGAGHRKTNVSSATSERKKESGKEKRNNKAISTRSVKDDGNISSDDEIILLKKRRTSRAGDDNLASDVKEKKEKTLTLTPRKMHNSWMYKDLDEETDDGEEVDNNNKGESKPTTSETSGHQAEPENGASKQNSDLIEDKIMLEENSTVNVTDQNIDGNKDHFINCIQLPDGAIHILYSSGSVRSLIPLKEAHDRFGFELVEFLISRAEFA